ncbi:aminoglycoside phosphotransferase family protein [bacterium]|nr:aminoglycoside phosphotransferase family protein [bacterium]
MSASPDLAGGELEAAVRLFELEGELVEIVGLHRGHIHDTLVSSWRVGGEGGELRRYVHQRLNDRVFRDLPALMHNVGVVTRHLARAGGANGLTALALVGARDGADFAFARDTAWRTYHFVEGTESYDHPKDAGMAHAAALAFGDFQIKLSTLPASELRETIPNFFNSEARLAQLDDACRRNPLGRVAEVQQELEFIGARRRQLSVFENALRAGRMPRRVIHGDTKLNNVLFDSETGQPRCIVDLDTCMPGYSLFDFGDLVRFTAATSDEDEGDLDRVDVDMDLYHALRDGYLEKANGFLNAFEVEHMAFAARIVTLTIGMRFLADHVMGDHYFKIEREGHNLDRARVQLRMVETMERRL